MVQQRSEGLGELGRLFIKNIVEQLVDLSRRNPLLNFRSDKNAIRFVSAPEIFNEELTASKSVSIDALMGTLPSQEQLRLLRRLSDRSRLLREERGVEVLHVALGLLRWTDENNGKSYNAPIMLLPVALARSGESYSLTRVAGEEPETNRALLELLRRHPSIRHEEADVAERGYSEVAASFAASIPANANAAIANECYLGLFSYEKLVMVYDIEANAEEVLAHPIVSALNGDPRPLALLQHGIESPTIPELDRASTDPNRVYVTEADSSQQAALEAIARGLSLVVQGPPGTGKSQTIVNLIAQAMFDGKSVLFVAEKKVALDVVFERLAKCGLGDAMLAVQRDADKKRFAGMLGVRHTEIASSVSRDGSFKALDSSIAELDAYHRQLHEPVGKSGDAPFQLYGRQARYVGETPRVRIEHTESRHPNGREQLAESIERLAAHPQWLRNPAEVTWASLRPEVNSLAAIHAAIDELTEGTKLDAEARSVATDSAPVVGPVQDTHDITLDALLKLLTLVRDSPVTPVDWLTASPDRLVAVLQRYVEQRQEYETKCSSLLTRYKSDVLESNIDRLADRFSGQYRQFWKRWFNRAYAADVSEVLHQRLDSYRKGGYSEIRADLSLLWSIKEQQKAWNDSSHELRRSFGPLFRGFQTHPEELSCALEWYIRFAGMRAERVLPSALCNAVIDPSPNPRERARSLVERLRLVCADLAACTLKLQQVFHDLPADRGSWVAYLKSKSDGLEEAAQYFQFRDVMSGLRADGCGKMLDAICDWPELEPDQWRAAFDRIFDTNLIDYAHQTRPQLAAFERDAHERLRERYAAADESNVVNGGQRVAHRLTELAKARTEDPSYRDAIDIIIREASKSRNVMPIRTLTRRAFSAIRVLKPCWMMSPLAVSQYLPPGQIFDLVVFDEASQMRPADAIPALSRGRQTVVVGDDKQLPPTNFFDNAVIAEADADAEEESASLADYESILDRCDTVLQQRMLRWHYRSRHESLITFSNKRFYDGRLVTFPTPVLRAGLGVRLFKSASTYGRGGTRQNRGEAIDVARLAYEHARTRPEETLGIIAFSQAQQRAIEDALERAAELDPAVGDFFSEARPADERVFVKNLESVQGDERDVIILSVGYGRDDDGKLSYNFGPLNRAGGGRRLNVAVTRAKNEMIVVSSIDDRDLDAEKCRDGGPALVRSYLEYVRAGGSLGGMIYATGRGVDSPFEEDVRLVLSNAGYKVHLQVGASGYRIDLAVCHPVREGEYILAVECDGATYHGTPTARDRDRLRDRTLRAFGWRIHRIWSRDWFRRRADEISRVLLAIESALEDSDRSPLPAAQVLLPPAMPIAAERGDRERMIGASTNAMRSFFEHSPHEYSKKEISDRTSLPEPLVASVLEVLIEQGVVKRIGVGRGTKYRRR